MQKRNVLNSPKLLELKRKDRNVLIRKISIFVFLFLLLLVGLGFLSRWEKINIKNVEISGNKMVETEDIRAVVDAEIAGSYLWFFPKTNFLFYPKSKIESLLSDKFARLEDVSVTLRDAATILVSTSERTALYTWCGVDFETSNSKTEEGQCYFMDKAGYIFDLAPYFSNDVYFKFFGVPTGDVSEPLGAQYHPDIFERLVVFKDSLKQMGVKPSLILIKDDGDIELYLVSNIPPPDGQKIIFKKDTDFSKVAENLQAALTTEPLQTDFKKKYSSLLYIDLRFGNKVYFKFK